MRFRDMPGEFTAWAAAPGRAPRGCGGCALCRLLGQPEERLNAPYAGTARWKAAVAGAGFGGELSGGAGMRLPCVQWVLFALMSPAGRLPQSC